MNLLERFRAWVRPASVTACMLFILLGGYIAFGLELVSKGLGHTLIDIMGGWLRAIPDPAWQVIGATVLTYFGAREAGKWADRKFARKSALPRRDPAQEGEER